MITVGGSGDRASKAIKEVKYSFTLGNLTPTLDRKWYRQFEDQLQLYKPKKLKRAIRANLNYTLKDLKFTGAIKKDKLLHNNLETLMEAAELTTKGMRRRSNHVEASHLLRSLLFAAELNVPAEGLYTAIGHDFAEYADEGRSFKVKEKNGIAEYPEAWSVLAFLERMCGNDVQRNLELLRRDPAEIANKTWERAYKLYLASVSLRIWAQFAKGIDGFLNVIEEPSGDSVLKASWQVPRWRKVSWLMSELLTMGIAGHTKEADSGKLLQRLRNISSIEFEKFGLGYAVCGERYYDKNLLKRSPLSGSPVISIFNTGLKPEIELPFVDQIRGKDILESVLAFENRRIEVVESLLPYNLCYATIFAIEAKAVEIQSAMPELVKNYDAFIKKNVISDFERIEWLDAAREANEERKKDAGSPTKPTVVVPSNIPPQGSEGSPAQLRQTGQGGGVLKKAIRLSNRMISTLRHDPPLAEGPA
jgi:hypothetical protein